MVGCVWLTLSAACGRAPAPEELSESGAKPAVRDGPEKPPEPSPPGVEPAAEATDGPDSSLTVLDPAVAESLERVLRGGDKHIYVIELAEDQVLDVSVEQRGVDVVAKLTSPRGRQLLRVDNPSGANGRFGPEPVFWVAEEVGRYRLTVDAPGGSGHYTIRLLPVRAAAEVDLRRGVAERAKADGDGLYERGEGNSWRQALERYEEAWTGFAKLGDDVRQADARFRIGEIWKRLGDETQASRAYGEALPLYEAAGNERQQALVLHQLCSLYADQRDQVDLALAPCLRALELWQKLDDRLGRGKELQRVGAYLSTSSSVSPGLELL